MLLGQDPCPRPPNFFQSFDLASCGLDVFKRISPETASRAFSCFSAAYCRLLRLLMQIQRSKYIIGLPLLLPDSSPPSLPSLSPSPSPSRRWRPRWLRAASTSSTPPPLPSTPPPPRPSPLAPPPPSLPPGVASFRCSTKPYLPLRCRRRRPRCLSSAASSAGTSPSSPPSHGCSSRILSPSRTRRLSQAVTLLRSCAPKSRRPHVGCHAVTWFAACSGCLRLAVGLRPLVGCWPTSAGAPCTAAQSPVACGRLATDPSLLWNSLFFS